MWINYGKSFYDFWTNNLSQPGVQVEISDEDGSRSFLIGEINQGGGSCDCCKEIYGDTIIVRYRILLTPEELKP